MRHRRRVDEAQQHQNEIERVHRPARDDAETAMLRQARLAHLPIVAAAPAHRRRRIFEDAA